MMIRLSSLTKSELGFGFIYAIPTGIREIHLRQATKVINSSESRDTVGMKDNIRYMDIWMATLDVLFI